MKNKLSATDLISLRKYYRKTVKRLKKDCLNIRYDEGEIKSYIPIYQARIDRIDVEIDNIYGENLD